MHYEIYKNARDVSWMFLLQHKICSLPVDLRHITSDMDIIVKKDDIGTLGADVGHIVLGHTESDGRSDVDEYAAERFAIGVLAPACVLWGLGIRTAEEIADLCNISITSAKIQEKRMQELYTRNKFLTSPLERQVFEQFSDFINRNKHKK